MDQTFSEYQLIKQLAQKTASSLYLARSTTSSTENVVIKVFDASNLNSEQEQEHFLRDVNRLKQLAHPYILPLLSGGIEENHPYLVNAYVPRDSLRNRLHALNPSRLPLDTAMQIIVQVGHALSYAHAWNILHANIKTENVLFNADGSILLTDFTLSTITASQGSDARPNLRTACYMAPECFTGRSNMASDQYALACLAYELLTGHPPFTAAALSTWQLKHTSERPAPLTGIVLGLPEHSAAAILKALSKDPNERFATITAFIEALTATSLKVALMHFTAPHQAIKLDLIPLPPEVPQTMPEPQESSQIQESQDSSTEETVTSLPTLVMPVVEMATASNRQEVQPQAILQAEAMPSNQMEVKRPTTLSSKMKRGRWFILSITCLCLVGIAVASQFFLPAIAAQQANKLSSSVSTIPGTPTDTTQATSTAVQITATAVQLTDNQRVIPMATPTLLPTATPTPTHSPAATPRPTATATPRSVATPSPTSTSSHVATPTPTPTPQVSPTPTPTQVVQPTPTVCWYWPFYTCGRGHH